MCQLAIIAAVVCVCAAGPFDFLGGGGGVPSIVGNVVGGAIQGAVQGAIGNKPQQSAAPVPVDVESSQPKPKPTKKPKEEEDSDEDTPTPAQVASAYFKQLPKCKKAKTCDKEKSYTVKCTNGKCVVHCTKDKNCPKGFTCKKKKSAEKNFCYKPLASSDESKDKDDEGSDADED